MNIYHQIESTITTSSLLESCMPARAFHRSAMLLYACLFALASGARMGATARGAAARAAGAPGHHVGGASGHYSWPSSLNQADLPAPPPQPPLDLSAATLTTHSCLWDSGTTCVCVPLCLLARSAGLRSPASFETGASAACLPLCAIHPPSAAVAAAAAAALPPQLPRPQRRVGPQRLCPSRPALPPRVAGRRLPLHPRAVRRRGRRRASRL